jgi:MFS family permease
VLPYYSKYALPFYNLPINLQNIFLICAKVLIHLHKNSLPVWRLGFFFHEMAFGLLSIFIPLYLVITLGGSLVELGIMAAAALLFSIPASFFWGYICDRTRRYKAYILLSFASATLLIFVFTLTTSIVLFIILYVIMSMLHVAHEAPKNILIAEHYSRDEWEKSFASYQRLTEAGWLIGLLLGLIATTISLNTNYTLLLCSVLNLAAFALSVFLVADPLIIFERRLVSIERKIGYASRGIGVASQILDGYSPTDRLKKESFLAFGIAIVFFSLASNVFLTPLPIFFAQKLALPTSMIFIIYMLNSGGAIAGYSFIKRRSIFTNSKTQIRRIMLLRSALVLLLVVAVEIAFETTFFAAVIMILFNLAYAGYYILSISLSMELIPQGKAGIFDVLIGLGAASGSFLGPYLAQTLGFFPQFLISSAIFLLTFAILKIFS